MDRTGETRTYTTADKLRILALWLDRKEHRNPFVRAWRAFWKPMKDDSIQQDLRYWAADLSELADPHYLNCQVTG